MQQPKNESVSRKAVPCLGACVPRSIRIGLAPPPLSSPTRLWRPNGRRPAPDWALRSPVLSPQLPWRHAPPKNPANYPTRPHPFFRCSSTPTVPPTNPNPSRPSGSTNHHAARRGFPQPRSKSTHETRAGEFELESSTCDAVEERLDAAEKGAPGAECELRRRRSGSAKSGVSLHHILKAPFFSLLFFYFSSVYIQSER